MGGSDSAAVTLSVSDVLRSFADSLADASGYYRALLTLFRSHSICVNLLASAVEFFVCYHKRLDKPSCSPLPMIYRLTTSP